ARQEAGALDVRHGPRFHLPHASLRILGFAREGHGVAGEQPAGSRRADSSKRRDVLARSGEDKEGGRRPDPRHPDAAGTRGLRRYASAAQAHGRDPPGGAARPRSTDGRARRHRAATRHGRGADTAMKVLLTPMEARVIGCLIEKQITTPDQYPLSLNALTNACNQKSNRDPMMDVDEGTVQRTLDDLSKKHFVMERSGFGSRVPKYQHRFCNTEFGTLKLSPQELAIVCELLVRGPQTPGELRTRASRMAPIGDGGQAEAVLEGLRTREDGPFVARLPREPGRRDSRYAHLFSGPIEDVPYVAPAAAASAGTQP